MCSAHHLGHGHGAEQREWVVVSVGYCCVVLRRPEVVEWW